MINVSPSLTDMRVAPAPRALQVPGPASAEAANGEAGSGEAGSAAGPDMRAAAESFEAAFISQMLAHSGLADSLDAAGGPLSSALSGVFFDAMAEDMVRSGGFGLADVFADALEDRGQRNATPEGATP